LDVIGSHNTPATPNHGVALPRD